MAETCPKCGAALRSNNNYMRIYNCGSWRDDDDNNILSVQTSVCRHKCQHNALKAVAAKLAAKLVLHRGDVLIRCHACGACKYGEPVAHNDGCPVAELEAILGER